MKELSTIVLVGLMGSGKSTIGSFLARYLNILYTDSDKDVESNYKVYVEHVYLLEGELIFRLKERDLVGSILIKPNVILATGGGSVTHIQTWKNLLESYATIWFKIGTKEQSKRVVPNKRPLTLSFRINLYKLLDIVIKERHRLYLKVFAIAANVNIKDYRIILDKSRCLM